VAEKRIDFTYDDVGQYATIITYANLAGTQLVSTATYSFDDVVSGTGSARALSASDLSHRYLWNSQAVDHLFADEQLSPLPPGEGQGEGSAGYDLTTPGRVLWALTDHENSVRDLAAYDSGTDVTTIANHRIYDSFGNLKSETNSAVDCLFGYTGCMLDETTGLQNNMTFAICLTGVFTVVSGQRLCLFRLPW